MLKQYCVTGLREVMLSHGDTRTNFPKEPIRKRQGIPSKGQELRRVNLGIELWGHGSGLVGLEFLELAYLQCYQDGECPLSLVRATHI